MVKLNTVLLLSILLLVPVTEAKSAPIPAVAITERLAADTPKTTVLGNTFIAPSGWTLSVRGPATILEAPEQGSAIALVDVSAKDGDSALAAAWAAYKPDAKWPLKLATDQPDKDGWTKQRAYEYQLSPNERRDVSASVSYANGNWIVAIYDMSQAVGEKRGAQVSLIFGRLFPKGYSRETFVGKKANPIDKKRLAELDQFIETGRKTLGIPGVALGIIQDGKVVFAGGYGVRGLDDPKPVEGDTLFMIASNTKALTTLLLAKLVEEGRFTWNTPAISLLPSFRLGSADTTRQVSVKHLICACTGMPRQDMEWLFEFKDLTPKSVLSNMATMQPTSKFGELFQYSNLMAGAGGFMGGHVLYPKIELGAAYDRAMSTYVFNPLGMRATTFDYARALAGNHAQPHSQDVDGKTANAVMKLNYSIIPLRPAGAAWSNANDMLRYISMELAEGMLPDGKRYIAKEPLLERRVPQVPIGKDDTYGMGLVVNNKYGIPVVHHGGDMIGYHSDMIWLPEQKVGAVILTNADPGWILRGLFRRKLLEVLFDGQDEANGDLTAAGKTFFDQISAERKLLTIPADPGLSSQLATRYANKDLGEIVVSHPGSTTVFDFGEWKSEVASRKNPDGSVSFLTTAPGGQGSEFVAGVGTKRTLMIRDAQHEYLFTEQ
ncbi:MAG: beta-lactamase family protein [Anaerolineae bacterium]|nr:beta-lactamase family protein [Gloeobacterales cyanobacterium ES-bin-313]